jgi:hypothetical protein
MISPRNDETSDQVGNDAGRAADSIRAAKGIVVFTGPVWALYEWRRAPRLAALPLSGPSAGIFGYVNGGKAIA